MRYKATQAAPACPSAKKNLKHAVGGRSRDQSGPGPSPLRARQVRMAAAHPAHKRFIKNTKIVLAPKSRKWSNSEVAAPPDILLHASSNPFNPDFVQYLPRGSAWRCHLRFAAKPVSPKELAKPLDAVPNRIQRLDACLHPDTLIEAPIVAALAQLVEHIIRNDGVTGSSPVSGTIASPSSSRDIPPQGLSRGSCESLRWQFLGKEIGSTQARLFQRGAGAPFASEQ